MFFLFDNSTQKKQYDAPIPFEKGFPQRVAKSIEMGHFLFMEHQREENFNTSNGADSYIWNYYNREITKELPADRYQIIPVQRGRWQFLLIYDRLTSYLYTLMRKKRLSTLRTNANSELFHYTNALARLNSSLSNDFYLDNEQMQIDSFDTGYTKEMQETLDEILRSMVEKLDGNVEKYVLVTFEMEHGAVKSMNAIVPAVGMMSYREEDWTDYLEASFSDIEDSGINTHSIEAESEIILERQPNLKRRSKPLEKDS